MPESVPESPPTTVGVVIDGESVIVRSGQTVAAALIGRGQVSWRRTRFGDKPRGVLCGIGACFDCLISVNGRANVRACMVWVEDGDIVVTEVSDAH